jgi:hypothetical protein
MQSYISPAGIIPHALFDKRQLPLLPEAVELRHGLAIAQLERLENALTQDADCSTVLAQVGAMSSPHRVASAKEQAITRAYLASDTEEEMQDNFLTWIDGLASQYLLD